MLLITLSMKNSLTKSSEPLISMPISYLVSSFHFLVTSILGCNMIPSPRITLHGPHAMPIRDIGYN